MYMRRIIKAIKEKPPLGGLKNTNDEKIYLEKSKQNIVESLQHILIITFSNTENRYNK